MNIWGLFGDTSLALLTQPVSVATITARLHWELWRENVIEWCVTPWIIALSLPPPPYTHLLCRWVDDQGGSSRNYDLWDGSSCSKLQAFEIYFSSGFGCFILKMWKCWYVRDKFTKGQSFWGYIPPNAFNWGMRPPCPLSSTPMRWPHSMTSAHKNKRLAPLAETEQPCNVIVFYSAVWNSTYFNL